MPMIPYLLCWSLAIFGCSNAIVVSKLLMPIRLWLARHCDFIGKMVTCTMCMGFYVGILFSLMGFSPASAIMCCPNFYHKMIFDAFLGSSVSWVGFVLINEKQSKL